MPKIGKNVVLISKLLLAGLVFYMLYRQIIISSDLDKIKEEFFANFTKERFWFLFLCLVLMPVNWFLESLKWKSLVNEFQKLETFQAIRAILCGLTVGIVTPQRIGEYGGRVLILKSENRISGILATFLCSLTQNIVNVFFGIIGIYFLNKRLDLVSEFWIISLVSGILVVLLFLYIIYRNTDVFKNFIERYVKLKWLREGLYKLSYLKTISLRLHLKVLGFSIIRFAVYVFQYILILWFFGLGISFFEGTTGVSSIYLIQSGIPLPPILDVAARAELAYLIWGVYSENVLAILSATYSLWVINLIIPSLVGLFYVIRMNDNKTMGKNRF